MADDKQCFPVRDSEAAHPVASAWRPILREVVRAIVKGDFALAGVEGVSLRVPGVAEWIREYVEDYGQTLTELPEETWGTSCAHWYKDHWAVLVDLWTVEGGRSDMVLTARVFEKDGAYRFVIDSVHVP